MLVKAGKGQEVSGTEMASPFGDDLSSDSWDPVGTKCIDGMGVQQYYMILADSALDLSGTTLLFQYISSIVPDIIPDQNVTYFMIEIFCQ